MPELLLSVGSSRWQAHLARGSCYLFTAPPGTAASSLRQRLLDGAATSDSGMQWQPLPLTGIAVMAPGMTLLSNLQVWENIVLPHAFHQRTLPLDAEQNLRRWFAMLRPHEDLELWLHRPVGRLTEIDRLAAILLRSLMAPSTVIVLAADWLALIPRLHRPLWLKLLIDETQAQRRSLLYLGEPVQAEANSVNLLPLQWIKAQTEAPRDDVTAA